MACGGAPSTAVNIVESRFNTWNTFATTAFNDAEDRLDDLANFEISFSGTTPEYSVSGSLGAPFQYQAPPEVPDIEVNYSQWTEPTLAYLPEITAPVFSNLPENTATKPSLIYPTYPTLLDPSLTATEPTLSTVTLPTAPDADSLLPTVPTLQDITLPTAVTLDLPTFTATAPTDQPAAPLDTFAFTDETYQSDLFDDIESNVTTWMAGTQVIPTTIWNALWDRSRDQGNKAYLAAKNEVNIRYGSRGFSTPPGQWNGDMQKLLQDRYNQSSETAREIAIRNAEYVREDIKFAVAQGIALEQLTINLFNERMGRAFEAARYSFQAGVDIFNAQINLYNAQYQAYRTEADVYKARIEAELSRLETYKAELDAQRLVGDINQQDIALYNAQLQSVLTHIEIYKGELAGVESQVRVDGNRVQNYIAQIEGYKAQLDGDKTKVSLFSEEMNAQKTKAEVYETEINAFAAELKAYATEADIVKIQKDIEMKWQDMELSRYVAKMEAYKINLQSEIERVNASVKIYDGEARIYASEIGQEQARVTADANQYEMAIQRGNAEAQLNLESAKFNLQQYINTLQMELGKLDTLAKSQVGLAQAALAALNVSASTAANSVDQFNYDCG